MTEPDRIVLTYGKARGRPPHALAYLVGAAFCDICALAVPILIATVAYSNSWPERYVLPAIVGSGLVFLSLALVMAGYIWHCWSTRDLAPCPTYWLSIFLLSVNTLIVIAWIGACFSAIRV